MPPPRARRFVPGWTLLELLIVLAIVGLFATLLLPAVQSARESARRTRCSSQLHQVGLALQNFESTWRFWPPGAIDGAERTEAHRALGIPAGVEHGWVAFLLPFMDQQALYDHYRFSADWRDPVNQQARETRLAALQCPSTPDPTRVDQANSGGFHWRAAPTDYAAVNGSDSALYRLGLMDLRTKSFPAGMLRVNQVLRVTEMQDGASNQLVIGEDAGRPYRYAAGHRPRSGGRYTGAGWADRDNEFIVHGAAFDGLSSPGPCPLNCTNGNELYSFHPGGALILLGDGRVRFLSERVELPVLLAAISRAAGESLPLPD